MWGGGGVGPCGGGGRCGAGVRLGLVDRSMIIVKPVFKGHLMSMLNIGFTVVERADGQVKSCVHVKLQ